MWYGKGLKSVGSDLIYTIIYLNKNKNRREITVIIQDIINQIVIVINKIVMNERD